MSHKPLPSSDGHKHLSPEEVRFLLGQEAPPRRTRQLHSVAHAAFALFATIMPRNLLGWIVFTTCLGVLPVLGNQLFEVYLSYWLRVALWGSGILLGGWILHTGAAAQVAQLLHNIHDNRAPAPETLSGCIRAMAACMVALPSTALLILGLILIVPPVSHSLGKTLLRRLRESGFVPFDHHSGPLT